ncbi:MAG: glycosyltransferase [Myxococcota bacterium]|nr:glycosyltransferase [Myxococcota bacterium]
MNVLMLYRPEIPSVRAQSLQVLQTAGALAQRQHRVTVLARRGDSDPSVPNVPDNVQLKVSPYRHPTACGLWFRKELLLWWKQNRGVVIARDKKKLAGIVSYLPKKHRILFEIHAVDSLLRPKKGWERIEQKCASLSDVLIANCDGTLQQWERQYPNSAIKKGVIHNATSLSHTNARALSVIRCIGSLHPYKGFEQLRPILPQIPYPLELIGPRHIDIEPHPKLTVSPAIPHEQVASKMASAKALLLLLRDDLFGRHFTSPLKLWDYLSSSRPIIAPNLPTIREIAQHAQTDFCWYEPHNPSSLIGAIRKACAQPARSPYIRTWLDRAEELEAFFP